MRAMVCRTMARLGLLLVVASLLPLGQGVEAAQLTFAPGDVFVSLMSGQVQWRHPDGSLREILVGAVPGTAEGMGFDAGGNLYVTRWCADPTCTTGNTVEKFNTMGLSQGMVGSGYNCNPHAIVFDAGGNAYVGQADCSGAILKMALGKAPVAFAVAPENRGSFWIDLAGDGCTMFYTSEGANVKRFDVCNNIQLQNFNLAPLPGGETQDLRILSDGGVLVASGAAIARLDATGALTRTYDVPGEPNFWAGVALVGDGTFWAANYYSSNIYRIDLSTGAVVSSFNTGTPGYTVVGVKVFPGP